MKLLLARHKISRTRFSLPLTAAEAAGVLHGAVMVEIESRGHTPLLSPVALSYIAEAARWLVEPDQKPGLLIMGLYGNGKTTLMRAICRTVEFITEAAEGYSLRKTFASYTARDIAEMCLDRKTRTTDYTRLRNVSLLAVDDLGEEPAEVIDYGMRFLPMADLLTCRYDSQLPTVVTTNLTPDDLTKKYGPRLRDRLREMMHPIIFELPSFRR